MPSMKDQYCSSAMNDDDLQKVTVGKLKPHNAAINLVEYDTHWPHLFEREAKRIISALGGKALLVEHIGSTSVPGLCAKPIIDILLVVADSSNELSYVPALEVAGYTLRIREPEWFEHRVFKGPDIDINLHVFSENTSEVKQMTRFRDWLRANNSDRDKYGHTKRSLAQRVWRHVQNYADAKTAIIQEIMDRANSE